MTELSPQAQAVLDAAFSAYWSAEQDAPNDEGMIAAAALRAAANQAVPEPPMIVEGGRTYEEAWTVTVHDDVRRRFLAIAAEMEATTT
jgi:hypothetical protein